MKKKILLTSLFGMTLILTLLGLSVEKVQASLEIYDIYNETCSSFGTPVTKRVTCTIITTTTLADGTVLITSDPYTFEREGVICETYHIVPTTCTPTPTCL